MRALWAMVFSVIALPNVGFATTLVPDRPPSDCHVYYSDNKHVGVQKTFGRFFREGYEFGRICGANAIGTSYFVGHLPVKKSNGVCRYGEVDVTSKIVENNGPGVLRLGGDFNFAWYGQGRCPAIDTGGSKYAYTPMQEVVLSDNDFLIFAKFASSLEERELDVEQVFSHLPPDRGSIEFKVAMLTDPNYAEIKLYARVDASGCNDKSEDGSVVKFEPGVLIGSDSKTWMICGTIVGNRFVPNEVGRVWY